MLHDLKNAVGWEQTGLDPKLASGWDPTPEEWALAEKVALAEAPRRVASDSDYDEEVSLLAQIYACRRGQRDRVTTEAGWTPTTADLEAVIEVQWS